MQKLGFHRQETVGDLWKNGKQRTDIGKLRIGGESGEEEERMKEYLGDLWVFLLLFL